MITYNELKEKCNCWTGYKRKPGTKPCAEDSCMKEELEKHHVLAFGRMNPITSGHEAVVNKLHSVAKEHGASHSLVVSHSQDAKKNPLTGEQKVAHAKNAFPGTNVSSASKDKPTILHHAAAAHAAGATHLHVIAGSDRHEEMHNLLHKYNGKDSGHGHYNFKKITVHSSGERDPDAEGTTGISASKMREHAASGNKAEFHKGAPSNMKPEHKDAMYNDVRKGMNIKEETTPYWKKPSFNKRMSQMAKQERKERERKEAEKTPVKEELRSDMGAAAYINDFIKSTNPRFNNKSKEERRKMAIGAFMAAKSKLKEGAYEDAEENKRSAESAKEQGDMFAHHLHMADHHDNLSQWHSEKGRNNVADSHARKSEEHHEKAMSLKEGAMQANGTDRIDTATSAPTASTSKDTTMGKKIKGFKFFNGENDKQMNMNQPVKETYDDNRRGFGKRPREDDEYHVPDPEVKKAKVKKEEVEHIDEKSDQARRNKTYKNLMAASKGARVNRDLGMTPADTGHKNNQQMNKAIGRAVSRGDVHEMKTGNPGYGYHGQHKTEHDADEAYKNIHAHVKSLTDSDDKTVKHYLDSAHGRHLVGREQDHEYVKKDFKKFSKYYKPEMHEATAQKGVNVDKVNSAGQEPHEEKFETVNKSKLKKVKEGNMKSYKEFLQSLDEKLLGKQHKIDKNKNGKVDAHDFELLRKEETERLVEYETDANGVYRHTKKATYGTSYVDPEGADETAADLKKKEKKAAGRKTGQRTGSYKPRQTMSKLKAAGATYK
jgi:hypothetical protein